ncbi:MAG: hypothetical protein L0215_00370 [Gemmataceae bacterium]|nr:hypothetical protein [Gemmataceae bacterium]
MKCQHCDQPATIHVTEMADGKAAELHVCEAHAHALSSPVPVSRPEVGCSFWQFMTDGPLRDALQDARAAEKLAAHLLPALCLALLDEQPEVRIMGAYHLILFGPKASSALNALKNGLRDPDERVRTACAIAVGCIERSEGPYWLK